MLSPSPGRRAGPRGRTRVAAAASCAGLADAIDVGVSQYASSRQLSTIKRHGSVAERPRLAAPGPHWKFGRNNTRSEGPGTQQSAQNCQPTNGRPTPAASSGCDISDSTRGPSLFVQGMRRQPNLEFQAIVNEISPGVLGRVFAHQCHFRALRSSAIRFTLEQHHDPSLGVTTEQDQF